MSGGVFGGSGSFGADLEFSLADTESFQPDMEFSLEEAKAATLPYEEFTSSTAPPLVLTHTNVKPVAMQQTLPLTPIVAVTTQRTQAPQGMSTGLKIGLALLGVAVVGAAVYAATAEKPMRANPTKRRTSRRLPSGSAPRSKPRVRRKGKRQRTTRDEFEVRGNYGYGHGFEMVATEDTRKDAKERLREYRENEPGIPFKIVRVRVPLQ